MAVYYFQGSPILAPLVINSNNPTYESEAVNLKRNRTAQVAQRWELTFNILTADNAAGILAGSFNNPHGVKSMPMPQIEDQSVDNTGITVNASYAIGADTINVVGGAELYAGRFIKFDNHSKIYMLKDSATVTGVASAISIYPALIAAVTNIVTVDIDPNIQYYRDQSDIMGITFTDGVLSSPGTISITEAL